MDVILIGGGHSVRECRAFLLRAGFETGTDLADDERCPVIMGDVAHLFMRCKQVLEAGRHLLIANPSALSPAQVATLLAVRSPRQALYLWSERRHHPAYRLISGLVRTGDGWRPRHLRHVALSQDLPALAALRWRACNGLAIVLEIAGAQPAAVSAHGAMHRPRGPFDLISIRVSLEGFEAFVDVGLGEAVERRETVLAAAERKAYVDELNPSTPLLLANERDATSPRPRSVSCVSLGASELAGRQCLSFLEGAASAAKSQVEADLWLSVTGCWQAAEASLGSHGATVEIREPESALRVINGLAALDALTAPPLIRVVS